MNEFLQRIEKLSPQRLSLLALDQHMRLEKLERAWREPVAIVGIGCRFPGGVGWARIVLEAPPREKRDAITEMPFERWDVNRIVRIDPARKGKISSRWGGFLHDVDRFDAGIFRGFPAARLPAWTRSSGCCSEEHHGKPWARPAWDR